MAWLCAAFSGSAAAESVYVKYRGPVPLDTFRCATVDRSSLVERVCYDAAQRYMVILLKGTYYNYCEIGQDKVDALLGAASMGKYFNANIRAADPTVRLIAGRIGCRCTDCQLDLRPSELLTFSASFCLEELMPQHMYRLAAQQLIGEIVKQHVMIAAEINRPKELSLDLQ